VTWFDNFCVLLRRDGHSQLVYKHAISTIMPGQSDSALRGCRRTFSGQSLVGAAPARHGFGWPEPDRFSHRPRDRDRTLCARRAARSVAARAEQGERLPAARLEEAVGLALAIDLDVAQSGIVALNDIRPATYIGKARSTKSPAW